MVHDIVLLKYRVQICQYGLWGYTVRVTALAEKFLATEQSNAE